MSVFGDARASHWHASAAGALTQAVANQQHQATSTQLIRFFVMPSEVIPRSAKNSKGPHLLL